ncbi:hypothetical protein C8F01DRAFT_1000751 [Mycena amicta]|nr:hypothetical protein C8F01DRAFT_1000751 [Mycena amicta]
MALPRRIVVDDTDPAIQYRADAWFPHDVNQLQIGNLGPVWNGTTQSTSVDGATLSFTFNGTSISLLGSIELQVDEDTGVVDPTWTCLVDEIAIGGADPTFKFPENNWLLCNQPTLLDGQHTLTGPYRRKGSRFYADSIVYTPMPDVSLDGAVLEYDSGDSAITYGKGWEFYDHGAVQNITQTKGAQVALSFHGTAVTLTGYVPAELPHNATSCKYSLDGGPETTFTLHGLPVDTNTSAFNVPILTVSALTPATHNLSITYEGDVTKTPLGVQAFYVTNAVAGGAGRGAASSSSSASGTPTITTGSTDASGTAGSDTTSTTHTKHSSTGAIAGGVIGGVLLLAALAALLFWCLRRRRQPPNHADDITAMTVESGPASFAGYQSNAGAKCQRLYIFLVEWISLHPFGHYYAC